MDEDKRGPGRPPKPQTFQMRVERDYWDANEERVRAGTIVEMTAAEAMDGVESGILSRVK